MKPKQPINRREFIILNQGFSLRDRNKNEEV